MATSLSKILSTLTTAGIGLTSVVLFGALGFGVWLDSPGGERWLANRLEGAVTRATQGGSLSIGELSFGLKGLVAADVALKDARGVTLLGADLLAADFSLPSLRTGTLSAPKLRLDGAIITLEADETGTLSLVRLFGGPQAESGEPFALPVDFQCQDLEVNGLTLRYSSSGKPVVEIAGLTGRAAFRGEGDTFSLSGLSLASQLVTPGPSTISASGDAAYSISEGLSLGRLAVEMPGLTAIADGHVGQRIDLEISAPALDGAALDPLLGGSGLGGRWVATFSAHGPSSSFDLSASLAALEGGGDLSLKAHVARDPSLSFTAEATLSRFPVARSEGSRLFPAIPQPIVVDGGVQLSGLGSRFGEDLVIEGLWSGGPQALYGQQVDAVDTSFALDGTALTIGGTLDGIVGLLHVAGDIDLRPEAMPEGANRLDLTISGDLDPERLAALGTPGLTGDGRFTARATGDFRAEPAVITVEGSARYEPFLYPNLSIGLLDAPFVATVEGGQVSGSVVLSGAALDANGLTGRSLSSPPLGAEGAIRFRRTPEGALSASGDVDIREAAYGSWLTVASADAGFRLQMAGGRRLVTADVALADYTLASLPGTDGTLAVKLEDDTARTDIWLRDAPEGLSRDVLRADVTVDIASLDVAIGSIAYAPSARATWTGSGAEMRIVSGGVSDLHLALESPLGSVSAQGRLGTEGPLDATVALTGLELDQLAELYPDSLDGLSGQLTLAMALRGSADAPELQGDLSLDRLFANGSIRWLDADGSFSLARGRLSPDLALSVLSEPLGHLSGEIPLSGELSSLHIDTEGALDLQLAMLPGEISRLITVAPSLDGRTLPEGRFSAEIRATGPMKDPLLHLAGVSEIAVPGWVEPGRVELSLDRKASELAFDLDLREGLAETAHAHGVGKTRIGEIFDYLLFGAASPDLTAPELYLDEMEISTALVGLPVESIAAAADPGVSFGGDLIGGFVVSGSPTHPVVDGALHWLEPEVGGQALDSAYLALTPSDLGYLVDASIVFQPDPQAPDSPTGGLKLGGTVPVEVDLMKDYDAWGTGDLALSIDGPGIPLSVLAALDDRFLSSSALGLLSLQGDITGKIASPLPELRATIEGGKLADRTLGVEANDIDLALEIDSRKIKLDHADFSLVPMRRVRAPEQVGDLAAAVVSQPLVHAAGTALLEDWSLSALSGKATLQGGPWLVSTDDTVIRTDGELLVSGKWPELSVKGGLDLVYGRVSLDAATSLDHAPLDLDPSLRVVRGQAPPAAHDEEEPPLYATFDVAVDLDLKRNLELTLGMPFVTDLGDLGAAVSRVDLASRVGGSLTLAMQDAAPTLIGSIDVVEGKARMLRSSFDLSRGTITFPGGDPYEDAVLDLGAVMKLPEAELAMDIRGTPAAPEIGLRSDKYPDPTDQMTILLTGRAPEELTAEAGAGAAEALAGVLFSSLFAGQSLGTLSIEPDGGVRMGVPLTPSIYAASELSPTPNPSENSLTFEVEWTVLPRVITSGGIGNRRSWGDVYWEIRF